MKNVKRMYAFLGFTLLMFLCGFMTVYADAPLPEISSGKCITTYTYASSGKVYAYTDSKLNKKTGGYIICKTDECKIVKINGNAVQVSYPVSNGRKTAWFMRQAFTYRDLAKGGAQLSFISTKKVNTYKWKGKNDALGYIEPNDVCYLLTGDSMSDWLQLIYPTGSTYKMGWVKGTDIKAVIWPEQNTETEKENGGGSGSGSGTIDPDPTPKIQTEKYQAYTGINYTAILDKAVNSKKIKAKERSNRLAVLSEAQRMVTLIWTPSVTFHTWKGSNLKYNSNKNMLNSGKPSNYNTFQTGCSYVGIPYAANGNKDSMGGGKCNTYNVERWLKLLNKKPPKKSWFEGTVTYLGKKRTECTYRGVDCSGLVYCAYKKLKNYKIGYLGTSALLKASSSWKKISASKALPGDILLKNGHVMIFLGKTSKGKIAVFESVAGYQVSGCRYGELSSVKGYNYYRYSKIAS